MKLKSNSANRIVAMLLFLFCFQFTQSQIQCRYWHTGDEYTDWGSVSPTHSPLPGNAPHASYATSTAYWTNGTSSTIDFTISDNNIHLYNPVDGPLDIPFFDMTNTVPGSEIVAIPKPGSECRHYYIIYPYNRVNISSHPSQQTGLSYVEFDSEYYNATVGSENNLVNYSVYQNTNSSVFTPAIAVTKMAADKSRFLYAVTAYTVGVGNPVTTRIYKYNITSSGITEVDMTPTLANNYIEINARIAPTELELSHNQQTLAFARTNNTDFNNIDLVTISLDASGNLLNGSLSNVKTYNLTDVIVPGGSGDNYTGIEFHPNNQTLYINNANDGIRSFAYTQTSPTPQISSTKITSSFDYSKSELELRYCTNCANPQICAVSNGSTKEIKQFAKAQGDVSTYSTWQGGSSNPERSQNNGSIIGVDVNSLDQAKSDLKTSPDKAAALFIIHGAGHNSGMNHWSSDDGPTNMPNIMTDYPVIVGKLNPGTYVNNVLDPNGNSMTTYTTDPRVNSVSDPLKPENNAETIPKLIDKFTNEEPQDNYNTNRDAPH